MNNKIGHHTSDSKKQRLINELLNVPYNYPDRMELDNEKGGNRMNERKYYSVNENQYALNMLAVSAKSVAKIVDSLSTEINLGQRTGLIPGAFKMVDRATFKRNQQKGKGIKQIFSNNPTTVILWEDGTKTISKCSVNDVYNVERGIEICMIKKAFGMSNQEYKRYMAYANRKVDK